MNTKRMAFCNYTRKNFQMTRSPFRNNEKGCFYIIFCKCFQNQFRISTGAVIKGEINRSMRLNGFRQLCRYYMNQPRC